MPELHAPTLALPWIEVEAVTGPGTNYPFGRFDLRTSDAVKFDLFAALAARITHWNLAATATYERRRDFSFAPPEFDIITATISGNLECLAQPYAVGPADVQIGDVESYNNGPFNGVWTNPHGSNVYPAKFAAQQDHREALIALGSGYDETVFAMNDVRLVSGPVGAGATILGTGDLETESGTFPDFYDTSFSAGMTYNCSWTPSLDPVFGPLHAHSYRSRRYGYVALILSGGMGFDPFTSGPGFSYSTHIPSLKSSPGSSFYVGPIGTLTVQWPHAITGDTLTVTCPIYGQPPVTTETAHTFTVNITMTPSQSLEYGGIFDPATGAPLRNPLGASGGNVGGSARPA